jgi:hypothetical protein
MKSPVHSQPRLADPTAAHAVGQDTRDVLTTMAGMDGAEIERLRDAGVIRIADEH